MMTRYRTPKGKDEREYPLPARYQNLRGRVKAIKYGHTLNLVGPGLTTRISDEIRRLINNNESVVICVTGYPGKGKTYMGMRWAQKLDPKFHVTDTPPLPPNQDHGQVTFSREHIAYLVGENSPIHRGQVILTDESHWGIGARDWQDKDQQELVNYLAAIRSKGYVLIIIVLHTEMVDKLIRKFVLNYEFYCSKRGYATVYRRYFPQFGTDVHKKRLGRLKLQMPDEAICNYSSCLRGRHGCKWLHHKDPAQRCMTLRAIYERRKNFFLNEKGKVREDGTLITSRWLSSEEIFKMVDPKRFANLPNADRHSSKKERASLKAYLEELASQPVGIDKLRAVDRMARDSGYYTNTIPK